MLKNMSNFMFLKFNNLNTIGQNLNFYSSKSYIFTLLIDLISTLKIVIFLLKIYVVVTARFPVQYGKYFPSFAYFVTYLHEKRGKYLLLSLKCKLSAIWLVETSCVFPIFLIATVQISMESETQESEEGYTKHFNLH